MKRRDELAQQCEGDLVNEEPLSRGEIERAFARFAGFRDFAKFVEAKRRSAEHALSMHKRSVEQQERRKRSVVSDLGDEDETRGTKKRRLEDLQEVLGFVEVAGVFVEVDPQKGGERAAGPGAQKGGGRWTPGADPHPRTVDAAAETDANIVRRDIIAKFERAAQFWGKMETMVERVKIFAILHG